MLHRQQAIRSPAGRTRNRGEQCVFSLQRQRHLGVHLRITRKVIYLIMEILVNEEAACASSPGSENRTSSSINSTSSSCVNFSFCSAATNSSTRCSGAEAPAVTATFLTPSSHSGLTSLQSL